MLVVIVVSNPWGRDSRQQAVVLLLPVEVGRLAAPGLAANVRNRDLILALLQNKRLLGIRKLLARRCLSGAELSRVRSACPLEQRRDARSYPSALLMRDASWRCAVLLNSNDLFPPRLRLSFKSAFRVVDSQRLCRSLRSKRSRLRHVPT